MKLVNRLVFKVLPVYGCDSAHVLCTLYRCGVGSIFCSGVRFVCVPRSVASREW